MANSKALFLSNHPCSCFNNKEKYLYLKLCISLCATKFQNVTLKKVHTNEIEPNVNSLFICLLKTFSIFSFIVFGSIFVYLKPLNIVSMFILI